MPWPVSEEKWRASPPSPPDHVLAIAALRRVLAVSPGHAATLHALAEHYVAQEAWGEAVEALEDIVRHAKEPRHKLAALLELAGRYAKDLHRPVDAERALRAALDVDPTSLAALRALLAQSRDGTSAASSGGVVEHGRGAPAAELAQLLARLAEVETDPPAKAAALAELAELRLAASDVPGAERALVEATAQAPTPERLARVLGLYPSAPADQARLLSLVVARGAELDRPDAASLSQLGQLEVGLGRHAEGILHLRVALGLSPSMHDARAALAAGLVRGGQARRGGGGPRPHVRAGPFAHPGAVGFRGPP